MRKGPGQRTGLLRGRVPRLYVNPFADRVFTRQAVV
jgi:hypothetical protein